jgi:hypothetical protein
MGRNVEGGKRAPQILRLDPEFTQISIGSAKDGACRIGNQIGMERTRRIVVEPPQFFRCADGMNASSNAT